MDENTKSLNLTPKEIISGIFRHKIVIIITFIIGSTGVYIGSLFITPIYEAGVKMYIKGVSQVASDTYNPIGARRIHYTQMEIVKSNSVMELAVKALNLDKRPLDYEKNFCHPIKHNLIDFMLLSLNRELEELTPEEKKEFLFQRAVKYLKKNIETELIPRTDIFFIKIKDYNPFEAVKIANVVSRSYVIYNLQQQMVEMEQRYGRLHPSVQQLSANILIAKRNLSGRKLPNLEAIGAASVKIIEQASTNNIPLGKPKRIIMLIGLAVSGLAGIAFAFLFDFLSQTFKSPEDIIRSLNLPCLGSIPKKKFRDKVSLINDPKSSSIYSQFFEELSDQLHIYIKLQNLKTILISSALPHSGNTTIIANIGLCFAQQMGIKTLIIDANLRNPSIHKIFNIEEAPGLANILEEDKLIEYHTILLGQESQDSGKEITISELSEKSKNTSALSDNPGNPLNEKIDEMIHDLDINLSILQAGKSQLNPINPLNNPKIDTIFKLAKVQYDVIIIDCPNLRDFKDAAVLSHHVDGVVLAVNECKDRRRTVMNIVSNLKKKKANMPGVILNRRTFPIPKTIYNRL